LNALSENEKFHEKIIGKTYPFAENRINHEDSKTKDNYSQNQNQYQSMFPRINELLEPRHDD
jgi:hypothetical protein